MARDKSRPDRPLEEGEMLSQDETHKLSAAFVAHIGKGYSGGRKPKQPLTDELRDMAHEHPELARLIAVRLYKMALLGRGKNALKAMEMIFERLEGPITAPKTKDIGQVTVIQQSYAAPQVESKPAPRQIDIAKVPTDEEYATAVVDAKRALRREIRPLPQPSDILRELEDDARGG